MFLDGVGGANNSAEAASHELGHNLYLAHDGTSSTGYYTGHGSAPVKWAPIMGVGYYSDVTEWSKGEYAGANNQEDDLQKITVYLPYRIDDHEDITLPAATPLLVVWPRWSRTSSRNRAADSLEGKRFWAIRRTIRMTQNTPYSATAPSVK